MNIIEDTDTCTEWILDKYSIKTEFNNAKKKALSARWIEIVESGTRKEFVNYLGEALDPLVLKILNNKGKEFVKSMPYEMIEWIKDSTILWVKNKGAGNSTTEFEI